MATKEQIREDIKTYQAWLYGEEIEWTPIGEDIWLDLPEGEDLLTDRNIYRIKPKPREMWIIPYPVYKEFDGVYGTAYYVASEEGDPDAVKYREVLADTPGEDDETG